MRSCSTTCRRDLLGTAQLAALGTAVRDGGLGLLTLGGRHAYSLGGYARSALDRVLPSRASSRATCSAATSRSSWCSTARAAWPTPLAARACPRSTMALSAARQTRGVRRARTRRARHRRLRHRAAHAAPDAARHTRARATASAGAHRRPDAPTAAPTSTSACERATGRCSRASSPNRHIILLTDGISQPHNYTALLQQLEARTTSRWRRSRSAPTSTRRSCARSPATGGNFYATADARDLPKIFVKETRLSAEPVQINGDRSVLPQASSPVVRSLVGGQAAGAHGQRGDAAAAGAQVDLIARSGTATSRARARAVGVRHRARRRRGRPGSARPGRPNGRRDRALERRRALGRAGRAARARFGHGERAAPRPRSRSTWLPRRPDARRPDHRGARAARRPGQRIELSETRAERLYRRPSRAPRRQLRADVGLPARSAERRLLRSTCRTRPSTCRRGSADRRSVSSPSRRAGRCSRPATPPR